MNDYIERHLTKTLLHRLKTSPAVALLGPRQCGKSTLTKHILKTIDGIYLDLERPSDRAKLDDPEHFFTYNKDKLICLDEIQLAPELFSVLRSVIDDTQKNQQFLILGSASHDLLKQSETLAGRISHLQLTPLCTQEIPNIPYETLLLRGGFPRSLLAQTDTDSLTWRKDFINSFLTRDLPQLGFKTPYTSIERFWTMCAHHHGQLFNASLLGKSLDVSHNTTKHYLDIMEATYMIRVLRPYLPNIKKRLTKSPKIYIRDTGILHALLDIDTYNTLLGHPIKGFSWESHVIETILTAYPEWKGYFYQTYSGAEIDLILEKGTKRIAIEIKHSSAPRIEKGFYQAISDLNISNAQVIAPIPEDYKINDQIWIRSLPSILKTLTR